jgi:glutamine amidotransferase
VTVCFGIEARVKHAVSEGLMEARGRPRIVVVDYGSGNVHSVSRALRHAGATATISDRASDIDAADAIVFPGVGAAGAAMRELRRRDLVEPIRDAVKSGRPFLGVCLGLQVLMTWSDEDDGVECLGIIPGRCVRLPDSVKLPHMGWNQVDLRRKHRLFDGIPSGENFYFVHSYATVPDREEDIVGETDYGRVFASCLSVGNVVATQFHPEKSAEAGLQIYRNFTLWATGAMTVPVGAARELV